MEFYPNAAGSGSAARTWVFETDANGEIHFLSSYKVSGDPLYTADGLPQIPIGTVKIRETQAPAGYRLNTAVYTVHFTLGSDGLVHADTPLISTENGMENLNLEAPEEIIRGGISVTKTASGGSGSLAGIRFAVINLSSQDVMIGSTAAAPDTVAAVITVDASGRGSTASDLLPYGTYRVVELRMDQWEKTKTGKALPAGSSSYANENYRWSDTAYTVSVQKNRTVTEAGTFVNAPASGTVIIQKELETFPSPLRSLTSLAGFTFRLSGTTELGEVYSAEKTTDESGTVRFEEVPYGTYEVEELLTSHQKTIWQKKDKIQIILSDAEYVIYTFCNTLIRGGISIEKVDAESGSAQGDAALSGIRFAVINASGRECVLQDGTIVSDGCVAAVLTTDALGHAATAPRALSAGSYKLRELRTDDTAEIGAPLVPGSSRYANESYLWQENEYTDILISEDGVIVPASKTPAENRIVIGFGTVRKRDAETDGAQGDANFSGIRFALVNTSAAAVLFGGESFSPGTVMEILTLDADGAGAVHAPLPYGSYRLCELRSDASLSPGSAWPAPEEEGVSLYANEHGYLFGREEKDFAVREEGETILLDFTDKVLRGGVRLEKRDAERGEALPQGDAVLSGIRFEILNDSAAAVSVGGSLYGPGEVVCDLYTDAEGKAESAADALPYGRYLVREAASQEAYLLSDTRTLAFEIREDRVIVSSDPEGEALCFADTVVRGGVRFAKVDGESAETAPQGSASLEGAEITVYNASPEAIMTPEGLKMPGEAVLVLRTDAEGVAESAPDALSYGTYRAAETAPSAGYTIRADWEVLFRIRTDGRIVDTAGEDEDLLLAPAGGKIGEPVIRADLYLYKVDIDGRRCARIPFLISRLNEDGSTAESHVAVTDENGRLHTAMRCKTDEKVNSLDVHAAGGVFTEEEALDPGAGVWFGEPSARDDARGALIYGNYRITELQCAANRGQNLLTQDLFIDPEELAAQFTEGKVFELGNVYVDLILHPESDLSCETGVSKTVRLAEAVELTDVFRYDHLKTTMTYRLVTEIWHRSRDGEVLTRLGENNVLFQPQKTDATDTAGGLIPNSVTVRTDHLDGGTLHAVDILYVILEDNEIELIVHNRDLSEPRQMLYVPSVRTLAENSRIHQPVLPAGREIPVADTVLYENLTPGRLYRIEGTLRDVETGKIVIDASGRPCVCEQFLQISLQAETVQEMSYGLLGPKDGQFVMPIIFPDASRLAGRTLVFTEVICDADSGEIIAAHFDLKDPAQQIRIPAIATLATVDGAKEALAEGEVTLTDTVTYRNLVPGLTYLIKASFYDKTAGALLPETSALLFVPREADGEVEIRCRITADGLVGHELAAFEACYFALEEEDHLVAQHRDPNDPAQCILLTAPPPPETEPEETTPEETTPEETTPEETTPEETTPEETTPEETVPEETTPEPIPETGDSASLILWSVSLILAFGLFLILHIKKKKGPADKT